MQNSLENKIFITGATGIIGKILLQHLTDYKVFALSRFKNRIEYPNVTWINFDLLDLPKLSNLFTENYFETVIHLAWENLPDYSKANSEKNYFLTKQLFDVCIENNVKNFISTGSCWEYGDIKGVVREDAISSNLNHFAQMKKNLSQEIISTNCELRINWLRLFYVYGPGQRPNSLIPTILRNLNSDPISLFNNPFEVRDYIYVNDVARAIKIIIDRELDCGIMNLSSGNLKTPLDFYNEIRILKQLKSYDYKNNQKIYTNYADLTKFIQKIGNFNFTNFSQSVQESI